LTLLNAGYFHTTFFPENYWNPDYWLHYGAAVVAKPSGYYPGKYGRVKPSFEPPLPRELLTLVYHYLLMKQKIRSEE